MDQDTRIGAEPGDAQLIAAVRAGDTSAFGVLFQRHSAAARRLARAVADGSGSDADDLVSEAFARVLALLQAGKGPDEAFRAYLLTAIRRLNVDRARAVSRTRPTDDDAKLDQGVPFVDTAEMGFESEAAATAFASLPERWQLVLWHLEVEGQKPADVAPLLGISANSVSALAYRAREGLRQAYLQGHLKAVDDTDCRRVTGLLGAHVRQGLSARDTAKVETHLDDCRRCTGLFLELREVNGNLAGLLAPAVLGIAAGGYLAGAGTAAAGAAVGTGGAAGAAELVGALGSAGGTAAAGATAPLTVAAGTATSAGVAGGSLVASAVVGQVARVALLPVQGVATVASGVASTGAQGIVAATVVTGVATAGVVGVSTDFRGPDPTGGTDTAAVATPEPAPPVPSEPVPTPEVTETAIPQPTPTPTPAPTEAPDASPSPDDPAATPEPTPLVPAAPRPPTPTDYAVAAPTITNDSTLLQRRVVVPVTARPSERPVERTLTATVRFDRTVVFRGIPGGGWSCDATRGARVRALTCTSTVAAGRDTTFPFKVIGTRPSGTVTVSAPEDPDTGNDSTGFRSKVWLLAL